MHSNHLRVTKKDQGLVGKCRAALTLSVQKVRVIVALSYEYTYVFSYICLSIIVVLYIGMLLVSKWLPPVAASGVDAIWHLLL